MTAKVIRIAALEKQTPSYEGQFLKTIRRRNSKGDVVRHEFWFKPDAHSRPPNWDNRFPRSIRVPRSKDKRTGADPDKNPTEYSAAWAESALLFEELQAMREELETTAPRGSLPWLCDQWEASDWFQSDLSPKTQHLYRQQTKSIREWAETCRLENRGIHPLVPDLTPAAVAAYLHLFDDRPTKRRHVRNVLKNICSYAIELGLILTNPVAEIKTRRTTGKKRQLFLWTQSFVDLCVDWAVENNHPEAAAMVLLMWDCGRRPADIFRLEVMTDLDRQHLMNGKLNATQRPIMYDREKKILRGWVEKTGNYISIPLDPEPAAALERVCPEPGENRRHMFVHQKTGEPYTTDTWKWIWQAMRKYAGQPEAKWQQGRASAIVRMKRARIDDAGITSISDHSRPETVYRNYWVADDTQAADAKRARTRAEESKNENAE